MGWGGGVGGGGWGGGGGGGGGWGGGGVGGGGWGGWGESIRCSRFMEINEIDILFDTHLVNIRYMGVGGVDSLFSFHGD